MNDRTQALLNVAVFTPLLVYTAQGRQPPGWLVAASLAYAGITFARDLVVVLGAEPPAPAELEGAAPAAPPRLALPAPQRYRVNRTARPGHER